ncbi:uncharacterized protein N7511_011071 [Penicillium nucicola]|uniref:uncharacterized protein n=1 Tax=Penicillium nucicola TaxID=1850975 RepID=UPI00254594B9|nr:uncharacterized protein N7511_011071 [Penicillium nucicola]KAJ5749375.1 hypothetical protein N7511_011071 [Penicillium nucicola]
MTGKRKSRGRGLRATTGCLVCKRRHVKCDETQPQCGPCLKGDRLCVYAAKETHPSSARHNLTQSLASEAPPHQVSVQPHIHAPLQILVDACDQEKTSQQEKVRDGFQLSHASPLPGRADTKSAGIYPNSHSPRSLAASPGTDISVTSTRPAPLSWFELLARDAANADTGFLLSPLQRSPDVRSVEENTDPRNSANLQPRSLRERESFQAAAFSRLPGIEQHISPQTAEEESSLPNDSSSWTTDFPVPLSELERHIFTHFVRFSSQWLDFYDPLRHFSTTVPHFALRSPGLMRALLAFTARHISLESSTPETLNDSVGSNEKRPSLSQNSGKLITVDRNVAVQYYYETLRCLNKAMRHPSYASSHEIVATALLISAYEMIDGSNQDWERHLKGVFWIQRFQDNDGECGGLRQAVWWAWLRQDVWVAMRERRRVFSFWQPKKPLPLLSAPELATRVTWLLGQCVNYASKEEQDSMELSRRLERGSELLYLLQQWHDYLPPEYSPLPRLSETRTFPPIWVHPSPYAASLQVHSLARILVILHRPSSGGLEDYRAAQKLLTLSVNIICGIAQTVDYEDSAAILTSLQCVFGADESRAIQFQQKTIEQDTVMF